MTAADNFIGRPQAVELSASEQVDVARFETARPAPESYNPTRLTPRRDFRREIDQHGNVMVRVQVGAWAPRQSTCNLTPAAAAQFLRDLADDVEMSS